MDEGGGEHRGREDCSQCLNQRNNPANGLSALVVTGNTRSEIHASQNGIRKETATNDVQNVLLRRDYPQPKVLVKEG